MLSSLTVIKKDEWIVRVSLPGSCQLGRQAVAKVLLASLTEQVCMEQEQLRAVLL
jgi:hypothetical protein